MELLASEQQSAGSLLPHREIRGLLNEAIALDQPLAVQAAKPLIDAGLRVANITERVDYHTSPDLPVTALPMHVFTLLLQGELAMEVGEKTHWMTPGQLLYTPPQSPYRRIGKRNGRIWFLYIEFFDLPRWEGLGAREPFARDYAHAALMYRLLRTVIDSHQAHSGSSVAQACAAALVALIDAEVGCGKPASGKQSDRLRLMVESIQRHPERPWNTSEMARELHMSRATLNRRFKSKYSTPPKTMIMTVRMARAIELLRETHDTIDAIAKKVGYESQFSFSNQFEKLTGMRPGAFRMKHSVRA